MARRRNPKSYTLSVSNYAVIGVVSYATGLRMVSAFNQELNFHFQQHGQLERHLPGGQTLEFPLFGYEDAEHNTLFRLITNRTSHGILSVDFRQFDFLIHVDGEYALHFAQRLLAALRHNKMVLASGLLPAKKLRKLLPA